MALLNWPHLSLFFYTLLTLSATSKAETNFGGIKSGRYSIVNCHPSNATHLSNLIQSLKSVTSSAMTDTERVHPGAAYNTFFHDVAYSKFVRGILGMTTTGISIDPQGSPIFWCVQGLGEISYQDKHTGERGDMYTRCQKHPELLLQGMHGTPFIVVCPLFYTLPIADSPPAENCLSVKHNRFKGNGWEMRFFRMWLVLQELVQFYVYAMTHAETHVQDVNKATMLGVQASVRNAENYVYYVANIYGNCTDFPILPVARPPEREFLTVSDNSTNELDAVTLPDIQNVTFST